MICFTCAEKILLGQLYSEYDNRPFCSDECIVIVMRHDGDITEVRLKREEQANESAD